MRELKTEAEIRASAETIWSILTDFASYPRWSAYYARILGEPKEGHGLAVHVRPTNGEAKTERPTVLDVVPGRTLSWRRTWHGLGILFTGEHYFELLPKATGAVQLVNGERYTGLLAPLFWPSLNRRKLIGLVEFNFALKERAEAGRRPESPLGSAPT